MKKKFLLFAAALVAVGTSLTGCVDSVESASVTNIRNAKSEQLKSLAALNNANAEAALILANAEKAAQAAEQAYKEAQAQKLAAEAEYAKAQAELLKAQAEYERALAAALAAQTEMDKQRLEAELKEAALRLQLLQAQLDMMAQQLKEAEQKLANAQAEFEIHLAQLQIQLQQAQLVLQQAQWNFEQAMKNAQKQEDAAAKQEALDAAYRLRELITRYDNASRNLINAKGDLLRDQFEITKLENGLVSAKQSAETGLANALAEKAENELALKSQQDLLAFYQKYQGESVTIQDLWATNDKVNAANNAKNEAWNAYWDAETNTDNLYWTLINSDYENDVINTINGNVGNRYFGSYSVFNAQTNRNENYSYGINWVSENNSNAPQNCRGKYCLVVYRDYDDNGNGSYIPVSYTPVYESADLEHENWNGNTISTNRFSLLNNGKGLDEWLACIQKTLDSPIPEYQTVEYLQNALKEAQDDQKEAATAADNAQKEFATADAKVKSTKKAYEAAQEATDAAQKAEQDAYDALLEAQTSVADPGNETEEETAAIAAAQKVYDDAQAATLKAQTAESKAYTDWDEAMMDAYGYGNWFDPSWAEWNQAGKFGAMRDAETVLNNADWAVLFAQHNLNMKLYGTADDAAIIDKAKELVAEIKELAPEHAANVTAFNDAVNDVNDKYEAAQAAEAEYNTLSQEYTAIYNALTRNGYIATEGNLDSGLEGLDTIINNIKNEISNLNGTIAQNETEIAGFQKTLDAIENGTYSDWNGVVSQLIAEWQITVQIDQEHVARCQYIFDLAKAELEAAIAAQ